MPRKDPIARAEYQRAYQERTDHAGKERSRYQDHPEYRERQRLYRLAHLADYAQYQQNSRRRRPRAHLIMDARGRAKLAGIPCTITEDDIMWVTHCPVFGTELMYAKGSGKVRSNSATLDRRTNELGYVPGNVFVISHRANRMKQDATVAELEAILQYMRA